ncbi:MAG: TolC family protein [Candidatus Marinimicrobia bacterium]|nr:TolC family protein [Candidatus Neomarinimicrobiota bacterium]
MRKSMIISLFLIAGLFAQEKLTLQECLEIARKNNPDMVMSGQNQKISVNQLSQAWGNLMPTIGAGFGATFGSQAKREYMVGGVLQVQPESTSESYGAGFSLSQPIFNSALYSGYQLAKNNVLQAELSTNQTRQYLTYEVTEKFYSYLKAQELLTVYQKAHDNSLEQLKKTEEMHRLGQVAQKDVLKAKVREGGDRLNIINQKQVLANALTNLKSAMGIAADAREIEVYEDNYVPAKFVTMDAAIEHCFENNTSLRLLKEQKQNAEIQYKMAKSSYLPTLSGSFSYNRGGNQIDRIYSEFDQWWSRSLSFDLGFSIFEGFKRKKDVQIKQIQYNIYDEQIRKEKITLTSTLDQLVRNLNTYSEMLEINEINLNSAKEDLRLAQEMYKLNSATFLEVLDAQSALTSAESDRVRIKYDMKIIEVQLQLAMGTL